MTLGTLMRERREELSLTKKDIAEQIDVTENTIMNWESDGHPPNPDKFGVIMDAYQIDRDTFAITYLDTVCPEGLKEDTDAEEDFDTELLPYDVRPLSKTDFSDTFPTEWYSHRMLVMLRDLKFSAEEVELWRMLDIYVDTEWYFADCWNGHEGGTASEGYISPVELIEYLPKDYVIKTGTGNILNMIYDIQFKIPNSAVENQIDKWLCPDLASFWLGPDDIRLKSYSTDGFDINDVDFYDLRRPWGLADISSEEYHGCCNLEGVFNRVTFDFSYLLRLIAEGNNIVFEKDLTKNYENYEYFNPDWWTGMISQMEECVKRDTGIDCHTSFEIEKFQTNPTPNDEMTDILTDYAGGVPFWREVVNENQIDMITTIDLNDDRLTWTESHKSIPSPFYDWIKFHYEKTDDKLICTASLTEKGMRLYISEGSSDGITAFMNEHTLNADVDEDAVVPMDIYNVFLESVWEYIDTINHMVSDWQEDPEYCAYVEKNRDEISVYSDAINELKENATHDMTFKDLKCVIKLGIFWLNMENDIGELLCDKARAKQKPEDRPSNPDYISVSKNK